MKILRLNKDYSVVCEASKTRNGFKHEAMLLINGREVDRVKCNYLNRTWERWTYETVIQKLLEKTNALDDKQRKRFQNKIKKINYGF